jgi:hypothetical protein
MSVPTLEHLNLSQWPLEVFVIQSDFDAMTKAELRAHVINSPHDQAAFHAFVDRFTADAPSEMFPMPQSLDDIAEVENLIRQRVKHSELE